MDQKKGAIVTVTLSLIVLKRPVPGDLLFLATTAGALIANGIGLFSGITVAIPHLLYIPVVIAAYRYHRWGVILSCCIAGIYLLMVVLIAGSATGTVIEALVRTFVLVIIGGLIALLSHRLHEREDLYHGLFYHSEAGSILIRDGGHGRVIEEANDAAAVLLHRTASDLTGAPLSSVLGREKEAELFSQLAARGPVHAAETVFSLPDGGTETMLVSAATLQGGKAILTFVEITRRVRAEKALKTANDKLNLLSRISADHLHHTVDQMVQTVENAGAHCTDTTARGFFHQMRALAENLDRQLTLTGSYHNLGISPMVWLGVQRVLESADLPEKTGSVSARFWTERLEIYADPLFKDVLLHLTGNAVRHGITLKNLVVTYHGIPEGLDLIFKDDGIGIPAEKKEQIFTYDAGSQTGIGLFICREILGVTGMTITETGTKGTGARFVIHVPPEGYRIEGTGEDAPAFSLPPASQAQGLRGSRHTSTTMVRELVTAEFPVAETLWVDYHQTKGDPRTDRIFAVFEGDTAVSVARCRRHPDGFEVDGVYTPPSRRGHGYANAVMEGLVEACGHEMLVMYSVKNLSGFYSHFGFVPVGESGLPPTIRERYAWAEGEMEGADVLPMQRPPRG